MTDKEIHDLLYEINNSKLYFIKNDFKDDVELNIYRKSLSYLQYELKLIRQPFTNETLLELTPFGNRVIKNGGWLEYQRIISEKENRSDKKDFFDFNISKFKYYTFWWFFCFAIIGCVLSVYNFTKSQASSKKEKLQEQRIEKMEVELEKLQTSILNKKNLHLLHDSKDLKNKK